MQINNSNDSDLTKLKTSMPTIYPNDYDFNAISGFGFNSTTSRSFVRPAKALGQEHRNISVPNSLKVLMIITLHFFFYFFDLVSISNSFHLVWYDQNFWRKKNTRTHTDSHDSMQKTWTIWPKSYDRYFSIAYHLTQHIIENVLP